MKIKKDKLVVLTIFLITISFASSVSLATFPTISSNYQVEVGIISSGGGNASSANYETRLTNGEIAYVTANSTNYRACIGFECLIENNAPLIIDQTEPTNPSTYSSGAAYTFTVVACDEDQDDLTEFQVNFEWDGTNNSATFTVLNRTCRTYSATRNDLSVGTYTYKWFLTDGEEFANVITNTFTVNRQSINIYLSLNNTQGNRTYYYPDSVNVTAWKDTTANNDGTITIRQNGTTVAVGSSPTYGNDTGIRLGAGSYNFSATFSATNYSANAISTNRFAFVNRGGQLMTLQLNGSSSNRIYNLNQTAEIRSWSNISSTLDPSSNLLTELFANFTGSERSLQSAAIGTVINITNTSELGAGTYSVKSNNTGNANFTSATSNTYYMTVQSADLLIKCEAGGPYTPSGIVIVTGNTTDSASGFPLSASITINILQGSSIKDSRSLSTSSQGTYSQPFGPYSASDYSINITSGSKFCIDTFTVSKIVSVCSQKNVTMKGRAFDTRTGDLISSGTVKASIKETSDEKETSFSGGIWSITMTTCITSGNRYNVGILVRDNQGRSSFTQTGFIAP